MSHGALLVGGLSQEHYPDVPFTKEWALTPDVSLFIILTHSFTQPVAEPGMRSH